MGVLLSSDLEQALQLLIGSPIFVSSDALDQAFTLNIQCGLPELSDRAFEEEKDFIEGLQFHSMVHNHCGGEHCIRQTRS
ncbi:hypothetical protein STEG23_008464 [Scotinomys teguina]